VTTTGATFDAAGRALRLAGAAFIWGVAAAHPR
jgi:predicted amidophosphoribosyltransferase